MGEPVQAGQETGRTKFSVTEHALDDYLAAIESDDITVVRDAADSRRIVPPELLGKIAMNDLIQDFCSARFGANIRAKQGFEYLGLVFSGQAIHGVGRVVEVYEKRGRHFVSFEAAFCDDEQRTLVIDRRTQLITEPGFRLER